MKRKRSSGLNPRQKHYGQVRNIESKAITSHNRLSKVNGKHLNHRNQKHAYCAGFI